MIIKNIRSIISEQLNIDKSKITPKSSFTKDLNMDSLDVADLVVRLSDEFNINLSRDMLKDIVTVEDMINCLQKLGIGGL